VPFIEDDKFTKSKLSQINATPISVCELHNSLAEHAMLITANQRLARFRLQQFEQTQQQQGKAAWHTPRIISWSVWLQELWHEYQAGLLLSMQQEALFWRDVVSADEEAHVLNPKALAKQAMDAWQILADYFIDPACLLSGGEEHMALYRWAEEVKTRITNLNPDFVQRAAMLEQLQAVVNKTNNTPIILDGFDAFSPAQASLINHLQSLGWQVFEVMQDKEPTSPDLHIYHDEETELRFVCQQIRAIAAQDKQHNIGLFIPDLEQRAAQVSQILSEELAPALSLLPDTDQEGQYFNLSLGSVLAKQPMIQAGLKLLSLTIQPTLDAQTYAEILHSPYLKGFADEQVARAALDKQLRSNNYQQISLSQLLNVAQHSELETPILEAVLQDLMVHISEHQSFRGKQFFSAWLQKASALLDELGWATEAETAFENAQLQGWKDMIHQLSGLDDFCDKLTWAEALARLQEYAFEQLFRPAPGLANIQVMGFLEASNLRFDEAFIISMDDHTWPPAAKPHPLIPVDIQAQYQTPHANSEREWVYAQQVWQNLLHTTPKLHVSYAKVREHQDMQPSPLLHGLQQEDDMPYASQRYAAQLQSQQPKLEDIADKAVPVTKDESIRGGTGILAAESACPFQAFAKYRLKLDGIEIPSQGLNSREQGILLHKVLEIFWGKHPSQQRLLDLIDAKILDAEIQSCISAAWRGLARKIDQDTQHLEQRRLSHLIRDWLLFEAERPPFKVVEREAWRDVKLGDLVLHTKLDRVDIDKNGHRIILDYKTGESLASKALGERPDAPQLPAYLLAEQDKGLTVDALAFAQVRFQGLGFKGFVKEDDVLPKLKAYKGKKDAPDDWHALTQHWQDSLNHLADEFMAGKASVTPKNAQACTYCDFESLCRIKNL